MSSYGQKVTNDPEAQRRVGEAAGTVLSDSLAGESVRSGGDFGSNNERANVSDQKSYGTTTNTTDTSNARRLDPAVDAEARNAQGEWNEARQLNSTIGQGKDGGRGPTWNTNTSGGDDSSYGSGGRGEGSSGSEHTTGTSSYGDREATDSGYGKNSSSGYGSSNVDAAPAYIDAQRKDQFDPKETGRPKGRNISEGGFDSDAPNASFNTTDIGGKNDPGRRGMQDALKRDADRGADAGYERDYSSTHGKGQYGQLDDERA
ncbi:hypothetical protein EJ05DRAFT_475260 [Pseudovirgaria hyperparasitica]|uniref:Uncharacterized protein n=1 Tax=Pseudovirgaria hyperparasitica TaxID=470096 RepID=A0A6A6WA36_9PEZI|nr:uncharacterized protein EJ05DRAFT_475260 [Pseudovirgaria hyperparasitica]KAF2759029.1 hypothetical protein EJ05DRAFT_475260 [Pseudovirgaria hyperparasitica]